MNPNYVEETYISEVEQVFSHTASFGGVIHCGFKPKVSLSRDDAMGEIVRAYPSFEGLPLFIAIIKGGLVAFSPEHPDFVHRVNRFRDLEGSEKYELLVRQEGAKGLNDLTARQVEQAVDLKPTLVIPDGGVTGYVRQLQRNYLNGGEAIEYSYSRRMKMITIAVPECLIVEFNIGKFVI